MAETSGVGVDEVLSRAEFDRATIEELEKRALTVLKDRQAIERFAAQEDGSAPGRVKRGVALAALGRWAEAVPLLESAPASSAARLLLARGLTELGQFDAALEHLKSISPDGWTRLEIDLLAAGVQAAAGRAGEGLKTLERHAETGRDLPEFQYRRGCVLESAGDAVGAAEAYEKALSLGEHPAAAFRLGRLADRAGDDELALESYRRSLAGAALYVNALLNLGTLCEDLDRYDEAVECFSKALRLEPTNPRALLFLKEAEASRSMYIDEDYQRRADRRNQVLETPVTDFELSVRSRNCLQKMGVKTLGDLARCTEAELLSYKNFGETSLKEIKVLLMSRGLRLGMGREEPGPVGLAEETAALADPEVLGRSVDDLELSVRGRTCLQRLNVRTVGELIQCTEAELLACKNFGQRSLSEIKNKLAEWGLALKEA